MCRPKTLLLKRIAGLVLLGILLLNVIAYNHAYQFTHFSKSGVRQKPEELSAFEKFDILLTGIDNPRPNNTVVPEQEYQTVIIQSEELLEGWVVKAKEEVGVVILFHGYSGNKSGNLRYSQEFNRLGYSTLLIDFMGSGGSTGNTTTIGFKEAKDVVASFQYVAKHFPDKPIVLFGSSMGAVAIMKAVDKEGIDPGKIILECPFGTMKATVENRFAAMGVPAFPFAHLLTFYGGFINGFDAFEHNPVEYARSISVPTLMLYGQKDNRVSIDEVNSIFENLLGEKELVVFADSGHENYLINNSEEWTAEVKDYLQQGKWNNR